jgi:hypothetical protein
MRASVCHACVGLGELDARDAALAQLLRRVAEPPRLEDQFDDAEPAGEFFDEIFGVEHALVAVEDLDADVQLLVEPDDGGGRAFAADVDTNPDAFAVGELARSRLGVRPRCSVPRLATTAKGELYGGVTGGLGTGAAVDRVSGGGPDTGPGGVL